MTEHWRHVDHPDDELYDLIAVSIKPRWKDSELSGDEWRFSYMVEGWRKGEVIARSQSSKLEWALMTLQSNLMLRKEGIFDHEAYQRTRELCDQPGCEQTPTIFYQRLNAYAPDGGLIVSRSGAQRLEYRQFCDRHKHRGDCGLDDADVNYQVIQDPRPKKGK